MNSILVTGCNRGIGLGLIKVLVNSTKPLKHIIATCRNPEQALVNHKFAISFNFVPTLFLFLRWLGCFDFCEPTHSHTRNTTLTVLENQHFFFFILFFVNKNLRFSGTGAILVYGKIKKILWNSLDAINSIILLKTRIEFSLELMWTLGKNNKVYCSFGWLQFD